MDAEAEAVINPGPPGRALRVPFPALQPGLVLLPPLLWPFKAPMTLELEMKTEGRRGGIRVKGGICGEGEPCFYFQAATCCCCPVPGLALPS